ncbi:MAG TPA: hypothetical protein VKA46_01215 [Gemmataceae bacterium]|nr:hypothetical protein [Gemmataceae bacterium]
MIPIPVFWKQYTATVHGRVLKVVPCENCSTEYVYLIEREGSGVGTSMYGLNDEGAEGHAKSAAEDTLKSVLENDFDPVPCPACGHYQRYMFPKLLETKWLWIQAVMLVVIVFGCFSAVIALYCSVTYLERPNDHDFGKMVAAWSVLLLLCLIGLGLSNFNKFKIRHFDPNLEDQQARIAIGRSRAVTRAEFERMEKGTSAN